MNEHVQPTISWQTVHRTLRLESEAVLHYSLSYPEIQGGGAGGKRISKGYQRLALRVQQRWQRELYWLACLELAQSRAIAHPFTPWRASLTGEVTLQRGDLLSLCFQGLEHQSSGAPNRLCWGDVWQVRAGAPLPLSALFAPQRHWRKDLVAQVLQQGSRQCAQGECFFQRGWEAHAARGLPVNDFYLTEEHLVLPYPQCLFSCPAQGTPVFHLPLPAAFAAH